MQALEDSDQRTEQLPQDLAVHCMILPYATGKVVCEEREFERLNIN